MLDDKPWRKILDLKPPDPPTLLEIVLGAISCAKNFIRLMMGGAEARCEMSRGRDFMNSFHEQRDGTFIKMMGKRLALHRCVRCRQYFAIETTYDWNTGE